MGNKKTDRRKELRKQYGGRLNQALFIVNLQLRGVKQLVQRLEQCSNEVAEVKMCVKSLQSTQNVGQFPTFTASYDGTWDGWAMWYPMDSPELFHCKEETPGSEYAKSLFPVSAEVLHRGTILAYRCLSVDAERDLSLPVAVAKSATVTTEISGGKCNQAENAVKSEKKDKLDSAADRSKLLPLVPDMPFGATTERASHEKSHGLSTSEALCKKCSYSQQDCCCDELYCRKCVKSLARCSCHLPSTYVNMCTSCGAQAHEGSLYDTEPLKDLPLFRCIECGSTETKEERLAENLNVRLNAHECNRCFRLDAQDRMRECDGCEELHHVFCMRPAEVQCKTCRAGQQVYLCFACTVPGAISCPECCPECSNLDDDSDLESCGTSVQNKAEPLTSTLEEDGDGEPAPSGTFWGDDVCVDAGYVENGKFGCK